MRVGQKPDDWTFEQRAAVAAELESQIQEALDRAGRLNQDERVELKMAERLLARLVQHNAQEEELPF